MPILGFILRLSDKNTKPLIMPNRYKLKAFQWLEIMFY